jgi:arylsulfatase A-like enzyme
MSRRPNILWVVTTQWRGQALGWAGDPNARTPGLDALARTGVAFARAFTPHPFGPFARAALLTGVRSPQNGVRDYFDPLPRGARTIADELNERGYRTGFFGKWHLGRRDPAAPLVGEAHAKMRVPPDERGGFQHWEGFESGFLLNDPWLHGSGHEQPRQFPGYQSEVVAARAAEWCGATRAPWFAVVSLEPPHPPYSAPSGHVPPRAPGELVLPGNVPRGGEVEARAREELAGYYAHIEATDRAIGRLVAAIGGGDTIAVVTSVHGDLHGAHGLFRKGWPYEESVRVPLIIAGGGLRRGLLEPPAPDAVVSLLDLPRWTLGWADGQGSAADGTTCLLSMPSVVALPHQCDRVWQAVRTPRWKLVLNDDGSPWLLFDLVLDPLEQRNLAAAPDRQEQREALRRTLLDLPR